MTASGSGSAGFWNTSVRYEEIVMKRRAFATSGIGAIALGLASPASAQFAPRTVVNAASFGARGDGITDDTAALQAAIDAAIYTEKRALHIPGGRYRISAPLHVGYGTSYTSLLIFGDGRRYRGEEGFSGTAIIASHVDAPAIVFQGVRNSVLRDLSIVGQNFEFLSAANPMASTTRPTWDDTIGSNWVDPQILHRNPDADSRHAPYAGVAIDPYSGPRPTPSYPDVSYPVAYVGHGLAQYGKAFSSDIELDRVEICGFVVGFVVQPCNDDGNGDFMTLRKSSISACRYGVSVGNSQSRNVGLHDCVFTQVHTVATTLAHGRQLGKLGGTISNVSVMSSYRIFDVSLAYAGPIFVSGFYCESQYRIGDFGLGAALDAPCTFSGAHFSFDAQQPPGRGSPAEVVTAGYAEIIFRGCMFTNYPAVLSFRAPYAVFEDCLFQSQMVPANVTERLVYNGTMGGLVPMRLGRDAPVLMRRIRYSRYDVDNGRSEPTLQMPTAVCSRSQSPSIYAGALAPLAAPQYAIATDASVDAVEKNKLAKCSLSGRQLRLTFTNRAEAEFALKGPLPGDIIWDDVTGMTFAVVKQNELTVFATALNNYRQVDGNYQCVTEFSTSRGNLYFGNTRLYVASYPVVGTVAALPASQLTSVGRADGYAAFIGMIQPGDWLRVSEFTDRFWDPMRAKVMAVDVGAKTITLQDRGALATFDKKLLPPFVRSAG
jgi:hypothetical protein